MARPWLLGRSTVVSNRKARFEVRMEDYRISVYFAANVYGKIFCFPWKKLRWTKEELKKNIEGWITSQPRKQAVQ